MLPQLQTLDGAHFETRAAVPTKSSHELRDSYTQQLERHQQRQSAHTSLCAQSRESDCQAQVYRGLLQNKKLEL